MPETIPQPRSLAEVCDDVRQANCGHCWQTPGLPCVTHPETGRDGYHAARFARANRRGLISDTELAAATWTTGDLTNATVIYEGGAR